MVSVKCLPHCYVRCWQPTANTGNPWRPAWYPVWPQIYSGEVRRWPADITVKAERKFRLPTGISWGFIAFHAARYKATLKKKQLHLQNSCRHILSSINNLTCKHTVSMLRSSLSGRTEAKIVGYLMEEMHRESMQSNIETGKAVEGFLLISAACSQAVPVAAVRFN